MSGEGQEPPGDRQERTVSVLEAARRLGKSTDAVRAALRRKTLEGYRGNQGDWRIPVDSLPPAGDRPEAAEGPAVEALRQELDRLREELAQARKVADDRTATVADLRVELGRVEERVTAREDLIGDLREQLARERVRADRLEANLYTPWWRRLFGR